MNTYRILGLATIALIVVADPAFAGPSAAPGPIAGIGLSALALVGGAYWVGRKFFARKK
jgi:hypothetical protein